MLFNATFNNISVILWRSVLLVEETGVPGENHWLVACHWQTLSHNVVSSTPHHEPVQTHNFSGDRYWLQGRIQGGPPGTHPPLKLEKIWFFGIKSWFFFKCAPPPDLKSWIRPWIAQVVVNPTTIRSWPGCMAPI